MIPFLILLIFSGSRLNAQNNNLNIDSLLIVLETAKEDTGRVGILADLGIQLRNISDFHTARLYADSTLILANKLNYDRGRASAYHLHGIIEGDKGNYSEALINHNKALELFKKIDNKQGIVYTYGSITRIHDIQGNYAESLNIIPLSIKLAEEIGDKPGIASGYSSLGTIHFNMGNYPEAMKYGIAALKIQEELGNKMGISILYGNIAVIHNNQHNYAEALKLNLAALKLQEEIGDKVGIAFSHSNIGTIFHNQWKLKEAMDHHLSALKIQEEIGDVWGASLSYNNLGSLYVSLNEYGEALKNHRKSLDIANEIGDKEGISSVHIDIGNVLAKRAKTEDELSAKLTYKEAVENLNAGLLLAKELGSRASTYDAYEGLAVAYKGLKDYEKALEYNELFIALKDSLLNNENSKKLEELRTTYEVEKAIAQEKTHQEILLAEQKYLRETALAEENIRHKMVLAEERARQEKDKALDKAWYEFNIASTIAQQESDKAVEKVQYEFAIAEERTQKERKQDQLVLLNKESEIQQLKLKRQTLLKNYFLGGFVVFGILAFFAYNNYSTRQKLKLQTLRNKIASDLHDDVGSTLSSISIFSQMAQQQSKDVLPLLETIGDSSRKMLDAMADIVWTINPENDQFEKIILRMRNFAFELLGAKQIHFEFIADENVTRNKLPMEVRKNLYLIFKEATNNMVKYSDASRASFSLKEEKDNLTMLIRDNGKGFDLNKITEGNGLKNMKKRAAEIGGKLIIDSFPGNGTTIELKIAV